MIYRPMSAGTSMFSFSLRSIAAFVKSATPSTPKARMSIAAVIAVKRCLRRVGLRSVSDLSISASRSEFEEIFGAGVVSLGEGVVGDGRLIKDILPISP